MPILPKHAWEGKAFDQTTIEPIIGSGPYVMGDIKPGESITYKKNPDYWGKSLPISRGLWNFDAVRFDYYRDANSAFEAFKKGEADVRIEGDPVRWTIDYDFAGRRAKARSSRKRSSRGLPPGTRALPSTRAARCSKTRACARRFSMSSTLNG